MATFIPSAANLRESFHSLVALRAPLPARFEEEKAVRRSDIRQYRHTATAACHESAWISLLAVVTDTEKENSFVCRARASFNLDKVFSRSFRSAEKNCCLFELDLNHLHGVDIVRAIPVYRVGWSVSRANNEMASSGVSPILSWTGCDRLVTKHINWEETIVNPEENVDAPCERNEGKEERVKQVFTGVFD